MVEESRLSRNTGGILIYIITWTIEVEFEEYRSCQRVGSLRFRIFLVAHDTTAYASKTMSCRWILL